MLKQIRKLMATDLEAMTEMRRFPPHSKSSKLILSLCLHDRIIVSLAHVRDILCQLGNISINEQFRAAVVFFGELLILQIHTLSPD